MRSQILDVFPPCFLGFIRGWWRGNLESSRFLHKSQFCADELLSVGKASHLCDAWLVEMGAMHLSPFEEFNEKTLRNVSLLVREAISPRELVSISPACISCKEGSGKSKHKLQFVSHPSNSTWPQFYRALSLKPQLSPVCGCWLNRTSWGRKPAGTHCLTVRNHRCLWPFPALFLSSWQHHLFLQPFPQSLLPSVISTHLHRASPLCV